MARAATDGVAHLCRVDPVLADVVARVGPCTLRAPRRRDDFAALARAIVFQQLAGAAAETIHGRFAALFGGVPTPEAVLACDVARLRAAGLSGAKAAAVTDLARATTDGRLAFPLPSRWTDDEVTARVTSVRGIGPWTAQMFLMFHLGRPDVLPVGDLGLRNAVRRAYRKRRDPTPATLERLAAPWRPWRSVATWYLWRSLDGAAPTNPAG
ncbi:MAG: DNA-3-methyladenine glycosylase [Planctomycetota bacterium]